jgi:hypothetical protein
MVVGIHVVEDGYRKSPASHGRAHATGKLSQVRGLAARGAQFGEVTRDPQKT